MRTVSAALIFLLFLLSGCGGSKAPPPASGQNVTGLTGRHSEEAELLFAKAHVLWKGDICSDPQEAVRLLNEVAAKEPDYAEAYARRGLAYSELGKREEAFEDLTKAIRLAPTTENYSFRALASLRGGAVAAAHRDVDYVLAKDAKQPRAWNLRGELARRAGNSEAACEYFNKGCSYGDCGPREAARKEGQCK